MAGDLYPVLYGQGHCAVCECKVRRNLLMCTTHWYQVSVQLRKDVYNAVGDFYSGLLDLGQLQEVQESAVKAVRDAGA